MSAQRMTREETQAVIRLWQAEQPGVADTPTLPDVAEGLDISVADAERLLLQVRAQRAEEERLLAQEQAAADLEHARLQEKQDLAEVRRQRAELQRQRGGEGRRYAVLPARTARPCYPAKTGLFASALPILFILTVVTLLFWLLSLISVSQSSVSSNGIAPCYINNNPAPASDCQAIEHGNYAPFSNPEYQHDPNKR